MVKVVEVTEVFGVRESVRREAEAVAGPNAKVLTKRFRAFASNKTAEKRTSSSS